MHDGSLKTIDEVLDHYNGHGKSSPNKDPLIRDLGLTLSIKKPSLRFCTPLQIPVISTIHCYKTQLIF